MTDLALAEVELLPDPEERRVRATGAVASIQEAELSVPAAALQQLWRSQSLERLARSYWLYLRRASLGVVRVVYSDASRTVVLGLPSLRLLRFRAPEYETSATSAAVTWRIEGGLLVAPGGRGRGWLRIEIGRDEATAARHPTADDARERVRIRVEVSNFYPWLRGSGRFARVGAWLYSQTQLRIHRRITIGFLRSLASLELPSPREGLSSTSSRHCAAAPAD